MKGVSSTRLLLLAAMAWLAGCSSSQMNRIDRNRAIYETWPLEVRQAVLDGKVEPGMNADMVRVAWGEPSEVSISPAGDEIWVYSRGGDPGSVIYPGGTGLGGVGMGGAGIGMGGTGIGISTGRGGTVVGTSGGIGISGGMGGVGVGGTGMGGVGAPIVTRPTPPDLREVVFRNGAVVRADKP